MRRIFAGLLVGACLSLAPPLVETAEAQSFRIGGHGLYTNSTLEDAFGLGARLHIGIPRFPLDFQGIYDYQFLDCRAGYSDCSAWTGVMNVLLTAGETGVYVGAGAAYHRRDFPPDEGEGGLVVVEEWGYDFVFGAILDLLPVVDPILEFRYEVYDQIDNQLILSAGIVF